jgi:hypothetical protein
MLGSFDALASRGANAQRIGSQSREEHFCDTSELLPVPPLILPPSPSCAHLDIRVL